MNAQLEQKRLGGHQTETKVVDEAKGIVEAIVSVTNIIDEVGDIIVPGAYTKTLGSRTPKVVHNHNWDTPVGKVIYAEELMPGDPRLTQKLLQVNAGALRARIVFNLETQRGRDAFSDVKFYGDEGEWSIGYDCTSPGAGESKTNMSNGVREIKSLTLFEISPVLFGAAPLTGTTDIKARQAAPLLALIQSKADTPTYKGVTAAAKTKYVAGLKGESPVKIGAGIRRISQWVASGNLPKGTTLADMKFFYNEAAKELHRRDPNSNAGGNLPALGSGKKSMEEKCQSLSDALADAGEEEGGEEKAMTAAAKDPGPGRKVCPTCDGTGKIRQGHMTCKTCNGNGTVPTSTKGATPAPADKNGGYGGNRNNLPGYDPEVDPVTNNWPPQSHEFAVRDHERHAEAATQSQLFKEDMFMSKSHRQIAVKALQAKCHVCLEGSYEDTQSDLDDLTDSWFETQVPMGIESGCWIEATYPDHIILGVWYSGDNDNPFAPRQTEFWQVPYTRDTANDSYTFGDPVAVDVTGVAIVKKGNAGPGLQVLTAEQTIRYGEQKNATRIRRRILLLQNEFGQDVSAYQLTPDQINNMPVGGGMIPAESDPSYLDNIMDEMPEGGVGPGNNFTNPPEVTPVGQSSFDHAGEVTPSGSPVPALVPGTYYLDDAGNIAPTAIGSSTDWMNLGDQTVAALPTWADSYNLGDQTTPPLGVPAHQPGTLTLAGEPALQNAAGNAPGGLSGSTPSGQVGGYLQQAGHPEGETKAAQSDEGAAADAVARPSDPDQQNAAGSAGQAGHSSGGPGNSSLLDKVRQRQQALAGARFHAASTVGKSLPELAADILDAATSLLQAKATPAAAAADVRGGPTGNVAPEFDREKLLQAHASLQAVMAQAQISPVQFGLPQNAVSGNDEEGVPIQAAQSKFVEVPSIKGLPMDEILQFEALTLSNSMDE